MGINAKDQRRYRRVVVQHSAVLIMADSIKYSATIFAMSAGNLSFYSNAKLGLKENIVIYIHGIDRFEGIIQRRIGRIYGMSLKLTHARREKLIEGLTIELARSQGLIDEKSQAFSRRSSQRIQSYSDKSYCMVGNNLHVPCSVVDISLTGVSVEMNHTHVTVGDIVQIGRMRCQAVRKTRSGFGFVILGPAEKNQAMIENVKNNKKEEFGNILSPAAFSKKRHYRLRKDLKVLALR